MARKKESVEPKAPATLYRVVNLTESPVQVPVYNEKGELEYLHLRLQGRGGQEPPTLPAYGVTDAAKELVRRKVIRLDSANQ